MKNLLIVSALLALSTSAFAKETVLEHCEGWRPVYFVDLVKIEEGTRVTYQVNLRGEVTNFSSAALAKTQFDKDCMMVKSWE